MRSDDRAIRMRLARWSPGIRSAYPPLTSTCRRSLALAGPPSTLLVEDPPIVDRHDLDELRDRPVPVAQQASGDRALGVAGVLDQEVADLLDVLGLLELLEGDHVEVAASRELAGLVEDERGAPAHPGGEVPPGRADHDGDAAGHVLAAVVADPFDDGQRPAVPDAEPLAGAALGRRPGRWSRRRGRRCRSRRSPRPRRATRGAGRR